MIKLCVEGYCHNCPDFSPEVIERPEIQVFSIPNFGLYPENETETIRELHGNTEVACKDRERCAAIYRHAKQEIKREISKNGKK